MPGVGKGQLPILKEPFLSEYEELEKVTVYPILLSMLYKKYVMQ